MSVVSPPATESVTAAAADALALVRQCQQKVNDSLSEGAELPAFSPAVSVEPLHGVFQTGVREIIYNRGNISLDNIRELYEFTDGEDKRLVKIDTQALGSAPAAESVAVADSDSAMAVDDQDSSSSSIQVPTPPIAANATPFSSQLYQCYAQDFSGAILHAYTTPEVTGDARCKCVVDIELPPKPSVVLRVVFGWDWDTTELRSEHALALAAHAAAVYFQRYVGSRKKEQNIKRTEEEWGEWKAKGFVGDTVLDTVVNTALYPLGLKSMQNRKSRIWWQCLQRTQGMDNTRKRVIRQRIYTALYLSPGNCWYELPPKTTPRLHQCFSTLGCQSPPWSRNPDGYRGRVYWHSTGSGKTISMAMAAAQMTYYSPFVFQTVVLAPSSVKLEHETELRRSGLPARSFVVAAWSNTTAAPYFKGLSGVKDRVEAIGDGSDDLTSEQAMRYCPHSLVIFDEVQNMLNFQKTLLTQIPGGFKTGVATAVPPSSDDLDDTFGRIGQLFHCLATSYLSAAFLKSSNTLYRSLPTSAQGPYAGNLDFVKWVESGNYGDMQRVRGFFNWFVFDRAAARAFTSYGARELFVRLINETPLPPQKEERKRTRQQSDPVQPAAPAPTTIEGVEGYTGPAWGSVKSNQPMNFNAQFKEKYAGSKDKLLEPGSDLYQLACFLCYQVFFASVDSGKRKAKANGRQPRRNRDQELQPHGGAREFAPMYMTNRVPTFAYLMHADATIGATATLYKKRGTDVVTLLGLFGGVMQIMNGTYAPPPIERVAQYGSGAVVSMMQSDPFAIGGVAVEPRGIMGAVENARDIAKVVDHMIPPSGEVASCVWDFYNRRGSVADLDSRRVFGFECSRSTVKFAVQTLAGIVRDNLFTIPDFVKFRTVEGMPISILYGFRKDGDEASAPSGWREYREPGPDGTEWLQRACMPEGGGLKETLGEDVRRNFSVHRDTIGFFVYYDHTSTVLNAAFDGLVSTIRTTFYRTFRDTLTPAHIRFFDTATNALAATPMRLGGGIITVSVPCHTPAKDYFERLAAASTKAQKATIKASYFRSGDVAEGDDQDDAGDDAGVGNDDGNDDESGSGSAGGIMYSEVQMQDVEVWSQTPNAKFKPTSKFFALAYLCAGTCAKTQTLYELPKSMFSRVDCAMTLGTKLENGGYVSADPSNDHYIGRLRQREDETVRYYSKPNALLATRWRPCARAAVLGLSKLNDPEQFDLTDDKIQNWLGKDRLEEALQGDDTLGIIEQKRDGTSAQVEGGAKLTMKRFAFDDTNWLWTELKALVCDYEYQSMELRGSVLRVVCDKLIYSTRAAKENDWTESAPASGRFWKRIADQKVYELYVSNTNAPLLTLKPPSESVGMASAFMGVRRKGKRKSSRQGGRPIKRAEPNPSKERLFLSDDLCPFNCFLKLRRAEGDGDNVYTYELAPEGDGTIAQRLDRVFQAMQNPYGHGPATEKLKEHCGANGENCYVASSLEMHEAGEQMGIDKAQIDRIWVMLMSHAGLGVGVATHNQLVGTNYKGISTMVRLAPTDSPLLDRQYDGRVWRYAAQQWRGGVWSGGKLQPRVSQFMLEMNKFAYFPVLSRQSSMRMPDRILMQSSVLNHNRQIEVVSAQQSRSEYEVFVVETLAEGLGDCKAQTFSKAALDRAENKLCSIMTALNKSDNKKDLYEVVCKRIRDAFRTENWNHAQKLEFTKLLALALLQILSDQGQTLAVFDERGAPLTWRQITTPTNEYKLEVYVDAVTVRAAMRRDRRSDANTVDVDDDDEPPGFSDDDALTTAKTFTLKDLKPLEALKKTLDQVVPSTAPASWASNVEQWKQSGSSGDDTPAPTSEPICLPYKGEPLITRPVEELGFRVTRDEDDLPHVLDLLSSTGPNPSIIEMIIKQSLSQGPYNAYCWQQLIPLSIREETFVPGSSKVYLRDRFTLNDLRGEDNGVAELKDYPMVRVWVTKDLVRKPESLMLFAMKAKLARKWERFRWGHGDLEGREREFRDDFTVRLVAGRIDMLMSREMNMDVGGNAQDITRLCYLQNGLYEAVCASDWYGFKLPALCNAKRSRFFNQQNRFYDVKVDETMRVDVKKPRGIETKTLYDKGAKPNSKGEDTEVTELCNFEMEEESPALSDPEDLLDSYGLYYSYYGIRKAYLDALGEFAGVDVGWAAVRYERTDLSIGTMKIAQSYVQTALPTVPNANEGLVQRARVETGRKDGFGIWIYRYTWKRNDDGKYVVEKESTKSKSTHTQYQRVLLHIPDPPFAQSLDIGAVWFCASVLSDVQTYTEQFHKNFRTATITNGEGAEGDRELKLVLASSKIIVTSIVAQVVASLNAYVGDSLKGYARHTEAVYKAGWEAADSTIPNEVFKVKANAQQVSHFKYKVNGEPGAMNFVFAVGPEEGDRTNYTHIKDTEETSFSNYLTPRKIKDGLEGKLREMQFMKCTKLKYPINEPDDRVRTALRGVFGWRKESEFYQRWDRRFIDDSVDSFQGKGRIFAPVSKKPDKEAGPPKDGTLLSVLFDACHEASPSDGRFLSYSRFVGSVILYAACNPYFIDAASAGNAVTGSGAPLLSLPPVRQEYYDLAQRDRQYIPGVLTKAQSWVQEFARDPPNISAPVAPMRVRPATLILVGAPGEAAEVEEAELERMAVESEPPPQPKISLVAYAKSSPPRPKPSEVERPPDWMENIERTVETVDLSPTDKDGNLKLVEAVLGDSSAELKSKDKKKLALSVLKDWYTNTELSPSEKDEALSGWEGFMTARSIKWIPDAQGQTLVRGLPENWKVPDTLPEKTDNLKQWGLLTEKEVNYRIDKVKKWLDNLRKKTRRYDLKQLLELKAPTDFNKVVKDNRYDMPDDWENRFLNAQSKIREAGVNCFLDSEGDAAVQTRGEIIEELCGSPDVSNTEITADRLFSLYTKEQTRDPTKSYIDTWVLFVSDHYFDEIARASAATARPDAWTEWIAENKRNTTKEDVPKLLGVDSVDDKYSQKYSDRINRLCKSAIEAAVKKKKEEEKVTKSVEDWGQQCMLLAAAVNMYNLRVKLQLDQTPGDSELGPQPDLIQVTTRLTEQCLRVGLKAAVGDGKSWQATAPGVSETVLLPKSVGKSVFKFKDMMQRKRISPVDQLRVTPRLRQMISGFDGVKRLAYGRGGNLAPDTKSLLQSSIGDLQEAIDSLFSFNVDLARKDISKLYGETQSVVRDGVKFDNADIRLRGIVDRKKNEEVQLSKTLAVVAKDACQNALVINIAYQSAEGNVRELDRRQYALLRGGSQFVTRVSDRYAQGAESTVHDYALRTTVCYAPEPDRSDKTDAETVRLAVGWKQPTIQDLISANLGSFKQVSERRLTLSSALSKKLVGEQGFAATDIKWDGTVLDAAVIEAMRSADIQPPDKLQALNRLLPLKTSPAAASDSNFPLVYFVRVVMREFLNKTLTPPEDGVQDEIMAEVPPETNDRNDAGSEADSGEESSEEEVDDENDSDYIDDVGTVERRQHRTRSRGAASEYFAHPSKKGIVSVRDLLTEYFEHARLVMDGAPPTTKEARERAVIRYCWCIFCYNLRELIDKAKDSPQGRATFLIVMRGLRRFFNTNMSDKAIIQPSGERSRNIVLFDKLQTLEIPTGRPWVNLLLCAATVLARSTAPRDPILAQKVAAWNVNFLTQLMSGTNNDRIHYLKQQHWDDDKHKQFLAIVKEGVPNIENWIRKANEFLLPTTATPTLELLRVYSRVDDTPWKSLGPSPDDDAMDTDSSSLRDEEEIETELEDESQSEAEGEVVVEEEEDAAPSLIQRTLQELSKPGADRELVFKGVPESERPDRWQEKFEELLENLSEGPDPDGDSSPRDIQKWQDKQRVAFMEELDVDHGSTDESTAAALLYEMCEVWYAATRDESEDDELERLKRLLEENYEARENLRGRMAPTFRQQVYGKLIKIDDMFFDRLVVWCREDIEDEWNQDWVKRYDDHRKAYPYEKDGLTKNTLGQLKSEVFEKYGFYAYSNHVRPRFVLDREKYEPYVMQTTPLSLREMIQNLIEQLRWARVLPVSVQRYAELREYLEKTNQDILTGNNVYEIVVV